MPIFIRYLASSKVNLALIPLIPFRELFPVFIAPQKLIITGTKVNTDRLAPVKYTAYQVKWITDQWKRYWAKLIYRKIYSWRILRLSKLDTIWSYTIPHGRMQIMIGYKLKLVTLGLILNRRYSSFYQKRHNSSLFILHG